MNDDRSNVVNAWIKKAENDLITAEHTMLMDNPPTDTICFHAQQCAEKYIKGLLVFLQVHFPKTHY
ncbi:HEPN domain-containing protein [bacterium]|nr:HEPN domain-containing protein [bacterium]